MTVRFTTPEENEEIKRLYRSGEWSFQRLENKYNLSKSTIIIICKGYPYGYYKPIYESLQNDSYYRLEKVIQEEEASAQNAYERGNYRAYGTTCQRLLDLLDHAIGEYVSYETIKLKRLSYEQQAWKALTDKEYEKFGYFTEGWRILTEILSDNAKNPWGDIPAKANARSKCKKSYCIPLTAFSSPFADISFLESTKINRDLESKSTVAPRSAKSFRPSQHQLPKRNCGHIARRRLPRLQT